MKFWIPLTILLIVAIIGSGTYYALVNKSQSIKPKITVEENNNIQKKTTATKMIEATVTLEPEITSIKTGDEANYLVRIDAKEAKLIGAETYLNYNAKMISVVSLEPGSVLPNPETLAQTINPDNGKVSYALGTFTPSVGKGIIFKIKVKGLTPSSGIQNLLSFDRDNTKIALVSEDGNKHYTESETSLIFSESQLTISP